MRLDQLLLHQLHLHAQPRRHPHRPVQPQQRRLHARRTARPEARDTSPRSCKRQGYQTAMIGKWHLATDPDRLRLLEHPARARASTTIRPSSTDGRPQTVHRLLHRPDRRFHARLAEAARQDQALLPDVPPQGAAPPLAARAEKYKDLFNDRDIPEPDNLYDHYEGKPLARRRRHHEGGRGHDQDRRQAGLSARPQGRRAAQVGLPALHQGLPALHTVAWTTTSAACSTTSMPRASPTTPS